MRSEELAVSGHAPLDQSRLEEARRRILAPDTPLAPQELIAGERPRLAYLGPGIWLKTIRELSARSSK